MGVSRTRMRLETQGGSKKVRMHKNRLSKKQSRSRAALFYGSTNIAFL